MVKQRELERTPAVPQSKKVFPKNIKQKLLFTALSARGKYGKLKSLVNSVLPLHETVHSQRPQALPKLETVPLCRAVCVSSHLASLWTTKSVIVSVSPPAITP